MNFKSISISPGAIVIRNGKERWSVTSVAGNSIVLTSKDTGEQSEIKSEQSVGSTSPTMSAVVSLFNDQAVIHRGKTAEFSCVVPSSGVASLVIKHTIPPDATGQTELFIDVTRGESLYAGPEFVIQKSPMSTVSVIGPDSRSELRFAVKRGDKVSVVVARTGDEDDTNEHPMTIVNVYMRIE